MKLEVYINYDIYLEMRKELGVSEKVKLRNLDKYKKDYSMDNKSTTYNRVALLL